MTHVDDFVDDYGDADAPWQRAYARWMFLHFRLPALLKHSFAQFIADRRLFCTWQGKRYRVTGASRLGDVWLHSDFSVDTGYEHRVELDECSDWSPEP